MAFSILLLVFLTGLAVMRPWRTNDEEWFRLSALLGAILLGIFLLTIT